MLPYAHGIAAPPRSRILNSHPIDVRAVAVSAGTLRACQDLDARIRGAGDVIRALRPDADQRTLALIEAGILDAAVPGRAQPVRFPAKPTLRDALRDRPAIADCGGLGAAMAGRALTPWHLRQANGAASGFRPLPFRTGPHHLAPDADGVTVIFPPVDCAKVLTALCAWLNTVPSLPVTAQALVAYLQICKLHAFHDGNGRTARMLLNAILGARLLGAHCLHLPLAAITFANAELLSAEYRRATAADRLDDFLNYGAALIGRAINAVQAIAAPQQST